jgi:ABC-type spermidine/putrescine transport system permease subunit II
MPVSRFARQTRWALIALTGAVLAFLYLPIAFLTLFSFEEAATPGFPITGLTLHWYQTLAADSSIQGA